MPNEYEFMKSARDKEMSDTEYKTIREQYDKTAENLSSITKKLIIAFLALYAASFVGLYISVTFNGSNDTGNAYMIIAAEFLLSIFLYDPKAEEDKKNKYETDKKILLNSVKSKIGSYKIKLGLVIGLGTILVLLNVIWWMAFGIPQESGVIIGNTTASVFYGGLLG